MQVQSTQSRERRMTVSEPVIPSVRGEFYNYTTEFSTERPLCYLFKCKANKSRPIEEVDSIDEPIDLVFVFGKNVRVCSPNTAPIANLLPDVELRHTLIAEAGIGEAMFQEVRRLKSGQALARFVRDAITRSKDAVALSVGTIFAVTTGSGKYGLFLVKEVTPSSVTVDACHILL